MIFGYTCSQRTASSTSTRIFRSPSNLKSLLAIGRLPERAVNCECDLWIDSGSLAREPGCALGRHFFEPFSRACLHFRLRAVFLMRGDAPVMAEGIHEFGVAVAPEHVGRRHHPF